MPCTLEKGLLSSFCQTENGKGAKQVADPEDKNLSLLESELKFISRQAQRIDADNVENFDRADDIGCAVESDLRALEEYRLSQQPAGAALAA